MPKGYVILTEAVKDEAGMNAYGRASAPSLAKGGATVLSVETTPRVLEGDWHGDRTVVLEFASVEAARTWYESDEYQEAKVLRESAAETNAVILSGFEMPSRRG
ncbi:DUF1330 domain-containing protein [Rhodococcus sp. ACPA4]|jgi:uncharacterized protein (DUF1330 family)|uniref:Uncharacterized protein (DUF1330 family) n=2 Tax=Nocardiaceae TaxID=85025 RepID=A0A652YKV9_NOCGL|nr:MULTISPECIES: DUF1330 domain-containing protein [Rhodococcus]NMD60287.1 DUF1330 domain-containing protein [Nocardia globerula]KJF23919.1 hypothetical protein SZ00_00837 [Rhodococcus sp. AD45]MDV6271770.1 DUF1330 domain-containing protein [Rhodococcus globerulus]MDV8069365.1 DUF1330 domain-containing protein [Rhodococcus sp. IEGM 1366]PBC42755.1 DUF1330 domain-containing protein [Rhodococcus sp. ACPA4]